jgi:hypothetical protein
VKKRKKTTTTINSKQKSRQTFCWLATEHKEMRNDVVRDQLWLPDMLYLASRENTTLPAFLQLYLLYTSHVPNGSATVLRVY